MRIIAHRGLTDGPDNLTENTVPQIESALHQGFDCEIDLWRLNDRLYLGHDKPREEVSESWVTKKSFWIHAKNDIAMQWLNNTELNYFWHETDHFTLTSKNIIWVYMGKPILANSICVMPEHFNFSYEELRKCYAICTDYPKRYREKLAAFEDE